MEGMQGRMEVRPLSGAIGAEVRGVELSALDEAGFSAVRQAFLA
jgi:alpha-ketoglutarate-dependent taurine dioxygenase